MINNLIISVTSNQSAEKTIELINEHFISKIPNDYEIWVADFGKSNDGQLPTDIFKYSKYEIKRVIKRLD